LPGRTWQSKPNAISETIWFMRHRGATDVAIGSYIHAAPNWVRPGAAGQINFESLQQWVLADHAVYQLVDQTGTSDEERAR
jgi:hypothetical protein